MSRKTIGLYKRYNFINVAGLWVVGFKRCLEWNFGVMPSVRIPADFISDYSEVIGLQHLEWEITLKRGSTDRDGVWFYSDVYSVHTPQNMDFFEFAIPQQFWDVLRNEGLRKEWCIVIRPYNHIKGEFDSFLMDKCAVLHSEHADNVINKSYDHGDLFGWLYGEDYSSLYRKLPPSTQVSAPSSSFDNGEFYIVWG